MSAAAGADRVAIPRPGNRQVIFYLSGGLAAAAAVVMLTTLLALHWLGQPAGGPPEVPPTVQATSLPSAGPPTPVEVHIGLDRERARQIVTAQPADGQPAGVCVVYPRRAGGPALAAPAAPRKAPPVVLTDRAPLAGTPYGREVLDAEPDMIFISF